MIRKCVFADEVSKDFEEAVKLSREAGADYVEVRGGIWGKSVTNADDDTVSIILDDPTPANIQWIMDLGVGEYPQGVDVDPTRNLIYVGNAWSRDLTVIDGSDHTVEKTIPLY